MIKKVCYCGIIICILAYINLSSSAKQCIQTNYGNGIFNKLEGTIPCGFEAHPPVINVVDQTSDFSLKSKFYLGRVAIIPIIAIALALSGPPRLNMEESSYALYVGFIFPQIKTLAMLLLEQTAFQSVRPCVVDVFTLLNYENTDLIFSDPTYNNIKLALK